MPNHEMQHRRGALTHPPTLLLLALLVQVALALTTGASPLMPWVARLTGGLLILVGVGLNLAAERGFKREGTPVRPLEPPRSLVTDGVFRWSRNPMYLGLALILLGSAAALASLGATVVVVVFVVLMDRLIRHEEALMESSFGGAYRTYRRRVRRWL